jgi:hypothetical protein
MFDLLSQTHSVSGSDGAQLLLTFQPLLARGQAVLAPDPEARVVRVSLCKTVVRWHNAFNEITIRIADDLFACSAGDGHYYDPLPKGGDLVQATFDFLFEGAAEPHAVEIIPPHTLRLQDPKDAPRILALLARRGFTTAQKLALALLLAAAGALDNPCAPDDDPSEKSALGLRSVIRN